jgi:hypothetical protein
LLIVLGWEHEADAAEVVFEFEGRLDIGEVDRCVDFSRHFELRANLEDSIMIQYVSSQLVLSPSGERSEGQCLPGERKAWDPNFKEVDATRADLARDIGRDAQISIDGAV